MLESGIGIEPVSIQHEGHFFRQVTGLSVLLESAGESEQHECRPGPSALGNHLDINHISIGEEAQTGIQTGAHEQIVHKIASRLVRLLKFALGVKSIDIPHHGGDIANDHGRDQELAEMIRDVCQVEDTRKVHQTGTKHAEVVGCIAVAVVGQALAVGCIRDTKHGQAGHICSKN